MKTKEEAEARLAEMPLRRPVTVTDTMRDARPRRAYSYTNPHGNLIEIELDADPSVTQLEELAANLPLDEADRATAIETMTRARSASARGADRLGG